MSTLNVPSAPSVKPSKPNWWRSIWQDWDKTQIALSLILLLLLALFPFVNNNEYYVGALILTTLYMFIGISWNIVAGFTGQMLIAHISFVAIGAYATVVLFDKYMVTPWIGILLAGVVAGFVGWIMALITLRYGLKADYFALFTIATMTALKTLFLKWDYVGGAIGMGLSLGNPTWQKMIFRAKEPYLYIIIIMVVIALFIQYWIYRSKLGKYFMAIREDESAAAALGVNTTKFKTLSLIIGAALAGIGGGFYMMYVGYVEPPQVFNLGANVEIVLTGPIIGGLGSLAGPVFGAIITKPLGQLLRGAMAGGRGGAHLIVYGSFLILAIMFMPRGIVGVMESLYRKIIRRSNSGNREEE